MLNKNGWGLQEMLILSGILIIFLVIAIYFIYTMYSEIDFMGNDYYVNMEKDLESNTREYLDKYYDGVLTSDDVIIAEEVLEQKGLGVNLVDKVGNMCSGYAVANKSKGNISVKGYIDCGKYKTDGYKEWR